MRELAARALHNLTKTDADYVRTVVLPRLVTAATQIDLHMCHGAVMAVGQIVSAVSDIAKEEGENWCNILVLCNPSNVLR